MKVQAISKKYFVNLKENVRTNMLKNLIKSRDVNTDIQNFLNTTKRIAISGYMNSEYIMTQQMPYKLVPGAGSYVPCKTIIPTEKINING
jgi:hypothetical protein